MMRNLFVLLPITLFSLYLVSCSSDSPSEPDQEPTIDEELQEVLDNGLAEFDGKGVSAAIIWPDGESWHGVSGISHGTTAITSDMPFGAGSITKNFTAAAILKLVEEGEMTLNDSLYEWLPSFPYVDSTITIRQLLDHTGGLYDMVDNPDFWDEIFGNPSKVWTPAEMITAFNRESIFPAGIDWHYSTTGYALLRIIIQEITGMEVSMVYSDRFFDPQGLYHTFASTGAALPENTAHGWFDFESNGSYEDLFTWPRTALASGIGGEIFATAEDLAKWARALLSEKSVLRQESLDQMLTFHSPCTGEEFLSSGYGLGIAHFNPDFFNGIDVIGHTGDALGYAAACLYLPDYDVCIGFLDNTHNGDAMGIINELIGVITNHLE